MAETLQAIVAQVLGRKDVALARIWLIDKGDICGKCVMRPECPNQDQCLHLAASAGLSLEGKPVWSDLEGRFRRFPIGVRKVGLVAQSGESVYLDDQETSHSPWIADRDWFQAEGIHGFAAHPLKFHHDMLGVIAIFSRDNISADDFAWLRLFAEQASIAIANARAFEELDRLRQGLQEENEILKEEIQDLEPPEFLIGRSPVWNHILQQIQLVGPSDATVLLTGESGTGKELVARAVHDASTRRNKPFVKVNCAAVAHELFESEFFGHVKGSFTGAHRDRLGRFGLADGGTILLDEVGEIPLTLQGKLLRVLQEAQYERVGEDRPRSVDVRVIAATNRNLADEIVAGSFRQDLYYRLSIFPIHIPPLRERLEDVPLLAEHFLGRLRWRDRSTKGATILEQKDVVALKNYHYPGNVRELENIIERAGILSNCFLYQLDLTEILDAMLLTQQRRQLIIDTDQASINATASPPVRTYDELRSLERDNLIAALRAANYRIYGVDGAAERLGAKPTTLASRIKALGIPMRPN